MFVTTEGKHPAVIGPSILHTTKEFEDYHYLPKLLKEHCKGFESLQAYGTDGELNILNAFICQLPDAYHLRCKIHLSDNFDNKLRDLSFSTDARKSILSSIFGRRKGDAREKGLADASSADDFDEMLAALKNEWDGLEKEQHSGEPKFHSWFQERYSQVMKEYVISPIREIAGLGSPPEFYTQNVAECCNKIIKGDASHKMAWSEFCLSLKESVELQERELKKAIHQLGEFRLSPQFRHLEVRCDKWLKMTTAQREAHLKRCFSKPLDQLGHCDDVPKNENIDQLSITYKEAGIATLSECNLKKMWSSAATIIQKEQRIISLPWDATHSHKMVFNGVGNPPINVTVKGYLLYMLLLKVQVSLDLRTLSRSGRTRILLKGILGHCKKKKEST